MASDLLAAVRVPAGEAPHLDDRDPADRKWVRDAVVAELLVTTLKHMDLQPPPGEPGLEGLVIE